MAWGWSGRGTVITTRRGGIDTTGYSLIGETFDEGAISGAGRRVCGFWVRLCLVFPFLERKDSCEDILTVLLKRQGDEGKRGKGGCLQLTP